MKHKPATLRITATILALLMSLSLVSCGTDSTSYNTTVTTGMEISSEIRGQVSVVRDATLAALRQGLVPGALIPFPEEPNDSVTEELELANTMPQPPMQGTDNNVEGNDIAATYAALTPSVTLPEIVKGGRVEEPDEFYIVFGKGISEAQRIEAEGVGYSFELTPYSREMYVEFSVVQTGRISYLMKTVYAKVNDIWQLYEIRYDEYAYDDMTSAELYDKAQQLSKQKYSVPSAVYAYLAGRVLDPCGIEIAQNKEISEGVKDIISAVNKKYDFPTKLILEDKTAEDFDRERAKTTYILGYMPVVTAEHGISVELRYFSETDFREMYETSLDEEECKTFIGLLGEEYVGRKELTTTQQTRLQDRIDATEEDLNEESYPIIYWLDNSFDGVSDSFEFILMTAFNRIEVEPAEKAEDEPADDKDDEIEFVYFSHQTEIEVKAALDAMREELEE